MSREDPTAGDTPFTRLRVDYWGGYRCSDEELLWTTAELLLPPVSRLG